MELKDILGFVDIGDIKTIDEFKEKFNGKFAPKSDVDDLNKRLSESTGRIAGAATNLFKKLGELENKDIEGKKWEEVAELAVLKYKTLAKDLETKQGQTNDDAIKDIQKKMDKVVKERDDYKASHETLQGSYDKDKGEWAGNLRNYKIGNLFEAAKGKIASKLKTDMSMAERLGFESIIKDIVVEIDDKDNVLIKDKDGKRLQNPNKAGSFLSLEDALELKANELNLIKKNSGGGLGNLFQTKNEHEPEKAINGRTIHSSALSHAERLRAQV